MLNIIENLMMLHRCLDECLTKAQSENYRRCQFHSHTFFLFVRSCLYAMFRLSTPHCAVVTVTGTDAKGGSGKNSQPCSANLRHLTVSRFPAMAEPPSVFTTSTVIILVLDESDTQGSYTVGALPFYYNTSLCMFVIRCL